MAMGPPTDAVPTVRFRFGWSGPLDDGKNYVHKIEVNFSTPSNKIVFITTNSILFAIRQVSSNSFLEIPDIKFTCYNSILNQSINTDRISVPLEKARTIFLNVITTPKDFSNFESYNNTVLIDTSQIQAYHEYRINYTTDDNWNGHAILKDCGCFIEDDAASAALSPSRASPLTSPHSPVNNSNPPTYLYPNPHIIPPITIPGEATIAPSSFILSDEYGILIEMAYKVLGRTIIYFYEQETNSSIENLGHKRKLLKNLIARNAALIDPNIVIEAIKKYNLKDINYDINVARKFILKVFPQIIILGLVGAFTAMNKKTGLNTRELALSIDQKLIAFLETEQTTWLTSISRFFNQNK